VAKFSAIECTPGLVKSKAVCHHVTVCKRCLLCTYTEINSISYHISFLLRLLLKLASVGIIVNVWSCVILWSFC